MHIGKLSYNGNQTEPDFLARFFDLKNLQSRDSRYNNAYDDIYQHMVNNYDWDYNWIYTDPRINMFHCDDETYLQFLSKTLHPSVRSSKDEVDQLLEIYNRFLGADGFEIFQVDEISGRPIFSGRQKVLGQASFITKKVEIRRYLNTAYVNSKIITMNDAINKDTGLAIGTAKELLETICKSILKQHGVPIESDWSLPRLLKETTSNLDFRPKDATDSQKAESSIRQILGGIASIVHGVTELRNGYGSGHGKDADFKGLEVKYAKLVVGIVHEIALLFLATNGETAEIIDI